MHTLSTEGPLIPLPVVSLNPTVKYTEPWGEHEVRESLPRPVCYSEITALPKVNLETRRALF